MDAGPLRDALTLVLGVFTGMMSGAFGVGGAVISTPGIRLLGASAITAVGTSLPMILPSAISGTARYAREGLIDWRAAAWTVPAGVVASVGGAVLAQVVPGDGHVLMILIALLLAVTAWRTARGGRAKPAAGDLPPQEPETAAALPEPRPAGEGRPVHFAAVGVIAGLLSGLLGIGGGVVMVPGFNLVARMELKPAIATSLVCVGAFAVPGTLTHALVGSIDWRFALLLAVAVVPGARLGATAAIKASDQRLRMAVAGFLGLIALLYGGTELAALLDLAG
jgi:uncharacterized protein